MSIERAMFPKVPRAQFRARASAFIGDFRHTFRCIVTLIDSLSPFPPCPPVSPDLDATFIWLLKTLLTNINKKNLFKKALYRLFRSQENEDPHS
jgi:hypothetical protein